MFLAGLVRVSDSVILNASTVRWVEYDEGEDEDGGGALLKVYFVGDEVPELVLVGSRAETLWDRLQGSVMDT